MDLYADQCRIIADDNFLVCRVWRGDVCETWQVDRLALWGLNRVDTINYIVDMYRWETRKLGM